jgi:NAD(P)-dependent dehydrogenase (short-subunit alcohol dehydrogenase family)
MIGAGPGIGGAVARRFAGEGLPVALIARTAKTVHAVAEVLEPYGVATLALTADVADEAALVAALDASTATFGVPEAGVYNAAIVQRDAPGELSVQGHQAAWAVNVVGAITAAAHLAPAMAQRGGGSFLITGGMPEPDPRYTSLSLGKAGVRALVPLLDEQYGRAGVHFAVVTVAGPVEPGTAFDPDDIAEHYWRLHRQPRGEWQREIVHR